MPVEILKFDFKISPLYNKIMLKRHITEQILQDLEYFPVVGIIGSRQVGKTTLAKYVVSRLNDIKTIANSN